MLSVGPLAGIASAVLLAAPLQSAGQPAPSPSTHADSARLLRALESEQARFERVRRNNLPWTWGGTGGRCDERIGRFCLSHGSRGDDWEPPPEPEPIAEARDRLIAALDDAAQALPGDWWVAGQRVRYLVEAGRHADARAAAAACGSERWWCAALAGFAEHHGGRPTAADSAFASMLSGMPEDERRRWTDLSFIVDRCVLRHYRGLGDGERGAFEAEFWRIADPFHSRPGNETRSEHFSRHVWNRLQARGRSAEGLAWGDDLRQILIRYGWPRGWERVRDRSWQLGPPSLVSHYGDSGDEILPPCETLRDGSFADVKWDREPLHPRTAYTLPMPDSAMRWVSGAKHQLAVFRRGDSAVVVASYRVPADSVPEGADFEASLAVLGASGGEPLSVRYPRGGLADAVAARVPAGEALVSIEALAPEARRAARIRRGLALRPLDPAEVAVSDLLLVDPDALPDSLRDAVARARPDTEIAPGERIGLYWEVYGLGTDAPGTLRMSIRMVEERTGWLRGLARRIGLVDDVPPVRVRWDESGSTDPVLTRSFALSIPDHVRPGIYALELEVEAPGQEPVVVRRTLQVSR